MNTFNINSELNFKNKALTLFQKQFNDNLIYNQYCKLLKIKTKNIKELYEIPFLPIQFFKTHKVVSLEKKTTHIFKSSGTTGNRSINYVSHINQYIKSFRKSFEIFYGSTKDYVFLGLLPSYLEQKNSSLVFMIDDFIKTSNYSESEFYLNDFRKLFDVLKKIKNKKIILFGVSYALLDFAERFPVDMKDLIVIETGGMKGRKKEISRNELHYELKKGFGVENIHSEYGMTELFSQAKGAINIIDLANEHSCAFIATDDLGEVFKNEKYTISGRLSESEIRGCNLMFN